MPVEYQNHRTLAILLKVNGTVFPTIIYRVLVITAISGALTLAVEMQWIKNEVFSDVANDIHAFYGLIAFLLGLTLSFRVNYAIDNWKHAAEAVFRLENGTRELMAHACAFVDDEFLEPEAQMPKLIRTPSLGRGSYPGFANLQIAEDGEPVFKTSRLASSKQNGLSNRSNGCPPSPLNVHPTLLGETRADPVPRNARNAELRKASSSASVSFLDSSATSYDLRDVAVDTSALSAIARIRNLALALSYLTHKQSVHDPDISDLEQLGILDASVHHILAKQELVKPLSSDPTHQHSETANPVQDGFRTCSRLSIVNQLLREEVARCYKLGLTRHSFANQLTMKIDKLTAASSDVLRLSHTPMPFIYANFVQVITWTYVLSGPFYLAAISARYAPIFSFILSILFFGLDHMAVLCEEPFGSDGSDFNLEGRVEFLIKETACMMSVRQARSADGPTMPVEYPEPTKYLTHLSRTSQAHWLPCLRLVDEDDEGGYSGESGIRKRVPMTESSPLLIQ